jgi:hypothetical protein
MERYISGLRRGWAALKRQCLRDPDVLLFERPGDVVPTPAETFRAAG